MLFSEKWLRQWVNPCISAQELMDQITMAGLEVDGYEPVACDFTKVVVGEIVDAQPHPNADKLQVCIVSNGQEQLQVVCGASNARLGIKVAFAQVGAQFPDGFKIKKAKLRQVESLGMLCSEKELGLSDAHDGIMELPNDAPVGEDLREYLQLDDLAIEVDLTPNRADCLGMLGLAREVAVLNELELNDSITDAIAPQHTHTFPINVEAAEHCPRYVGRIIRNVDLSVSTPLWMVERLRRGGIRSIDAVVDVTNYVLLELGQPMHAFDLDQLKQGLVVRLANGEESITLLDGQKIQPDNKTLLIADQQGPLALAGVMGGEHSGVSQTTQSIFLESAFFTPKLIAGCARRYGLHTDSSHRFERGVDYNLQERAIERATQLLLDITGGEPGPVQVHVNEQTLPEHTQVQLKKANIQRLLGIQLEEQDVLGILGRLGLTLTSQDDASWHFDVPSWRFDISIEEDLIEELARVYGYNNLPVIQPNLQLQIPKKPENEVALETMRSQLVARGYQEVINYSFVDEKTQLLIEPEQEAMKLLNPLSADLAVMRTSLWTGLIKSLSHNLKRQQDRVLIFETGLRFRRVGDQTLQENVISGLAHGTQFSKSWFENGEQIDFFDVKGDVESLLQLSLGNEFAFVPGKHPALHPGQTARIEKAGKLVGFVGQLHPAVQKSLGLKNPTYVFECLLDSICKSKLPQATALSKFPESKRDLAVLVDRVIAVQELLDTVQAQAGEFLVNSLLFDVYQGEGIDPERKSVAMGLTWQHPSRTLTDEEINAIMDKVISTLSSRFGAILRS